MLQLSISSYLWRVKAKTLSELSPLSFTLESKFVLAIEQEGVPSARNAYPPETIMHHFLDEKNGYKPTLLLTSLILSMKQF